MTPEAWVLNVGAVIGSIAAAYQAWESKVEARKAKELSEPTGNGFAADMRGRLSQIESKLDGHIHDHLTEVFHKGKDD